MAIITLRVTDKLKRALVEVASTERRSLNRQLEHWLIDALVEWEISNGDTETYKEILKEGKECQTTSSD